MKEETSRNLCLRKMHFDCVLSRDGLIRNVVWRSDRSDPGIVPFLTGRSLLDLIGPQAEERRSLLQLLQSNQPGLLSVDMRIGAERRLWLSLQPSQSDEVLAFGSLDDTKTREQHDAGLAGMMRREDEARDRERQMRLEAEALLKSLKSLIEARSIREKCESLFAAFLDILKHDSGLILRRTGRYRFSIVAATHAPAIGRSLSEESIAPCLADESERVDHVPALTALHLSEQGFPLSSEQPFMSSKIKIGRDHAHILIFKRAGEGFTNRDQLTFQRLQMLAAQIFEAEQSRTQILELSKFASMGEMISIIAHEVNQPLGTIAMSAENALLLSERPDEIEAVRAKLTRIKTFALRAGAIIEKVRALAYPRRDGDGAAIANVGEVARGLLLLMQENFHKYDIDVQIWGGDQVLVLGHPVNLQQILLNLISNARDAIMERRKVLKSEFSGTIKVKFDQHEDAVVIQVSDNGGGIPPDVLDRIFDRFFTLKKAGKGTGLGLSICGQLVGDMNGFIEAGNNEDGAVFTIRLPADEAHHAEAGALELS